MNSRIPADPYLELSMCRDSFPYFAEKYCCIYHPMRGVSSFVLNEEQKELVKSFNSDRYVLVKKYRQGGFTTTAVLHAFWEGMFFGNRDIHIAFKSTREAECAAGIIENALVGIPEWMQPAFDTDLKTKKKFRTTGSVITFGTELQVRGRHLTRLVVDEPAFWLNFEEKWLNMLPACTNTSIAALSTINGVGNWFWSTWEKAVAGLNAFKPFAGDYRKNPEYAKKDIELLRKQLGERGFAQEVLGEFVIQTDK